MSELLTDLTRREFHENFIKEKIPSWLTGAPAARRRALKEVRPSIANWYRSASTASHEALKQAIARSWASQSTVDHLLATLADVQQFAEPLLRQALKSQFGLELDVRKTCLRLYIPKGLVRGYEVKTISLLEAALHNFESKETAAGYFDGASCFISEPTASGQFDVLSLTPRLTIAAFASLCRRLDIGGQYQQRLAALLLPKKAAAKTRLVHQVITSQQDQLRASLLLAHMKGDIDEGARNMLSGLLAGGQNPLFAGKTQHFHQLSILGATLTGIVLFAADLEHASDVVPLIAYVPHDPEHPLKAYASTGEFAAELVRQLRAPAYQRFFAQFVAHDQRGNFFTLLNDALSKVVWHQHEPGDPRPAWRTVPTARPILRLQVQSGQGDVWTWLYQAKLNKILNDAQTIAVSTAQEDRKSRWEQWDRLQNVATTVVEVATLVVLPFVPFLGELMLAYTAYQLLDDTFTGILDWSEGQLIEASAHLQSIAENVAQLSVFAVGGVVLGKLLAIKPSAFIENLKIVDAGAGKQRLWNPDLSVYEHALPLPIDSPPDELGLHRHAGTTLLPLERRVYEIEAGAFDEGYRIRHPDRPDAYQPRLTHNGVGAWAHEVERPMEWQGAQLFRRLGHSVAEFSDATAARILAVSGIDEAVLRDMHVHARRPPALLEDTLRRFRLDQRIQTFIAQMQNSDPAVYTKADPRLQAQLLRAQGVSVPQGWLRSGDLVSGAVESLDDATLKELLGESPAFGDTLPGIDARSARLRARMVSWAEQDRSALFKALDDSFEPSSDKPIQQMRRIFPDLPKAIAQELWRNASAADRVHMQNKPGLTQSMAHEALFYLREVRLSRACEGLYLDSVAGPDSDKLALHMLETLRGWSSDIRIEVRDGQFDGALLDSIGRTDAPIRKVLVRLGRQYQAHDGFGMELHGLGDLYAAVIHALPDAQRQALGLPHVGQGNGLKQAIRQQALPSRSQLRVLLKQPPLEPGARSPMGLAVGRSGYLLGGGDFVPELVRSIEQRLQALYPTLSEEEVATLRRERLTGDPLLSIARLENEYVTLVNELETWTADVPATHPVSGKVLTLEESSVQRQRRALFTEVVRASWSRRLTENNRFETERFFSKVDIIGSLPQLSANFSHISEFLLVNSSPYLRAGNFLNGFSSLKYLTIRGIRLDAFPVETFRMRELVVLNLDNCNLRLDEASAEGLAHMDGLEELDLDDNPLGVAPFVGHMKNLETLRLSRTDLKRVPEGLFDLEKLRHADLTGNHIVELPDDLFELDDARNVSYNFIDNPLSESSRGRIAAYNENYSLDRKLLIHFEAEGEDVSGSDSDDDTETDDSGRDSLSEDSDDE
ncbi:dermonecrotic toxin domain-containing protein [Pseudomonas sp. MDT1-17]